VKQPTNLANGEFWEADYYRGIEIPARPDPNFPFERCLARALEETASVRAEARVLELGCAPARWLLWYAERFGASVTGIELSPEGVRLSRENLAAAGVEGTIVEADLFADQPALGAFDLVLSLGVIEHFDDIPRAFARHASFVGDHGRLVLGMPNYRGLIGLLQKISDRDHLRLHNTEAMDPRLYRSLAEANGMTPEQTRYIDGADPVMVAAHGRVMPNMLRLLQLWRQLQFGDHVNHRLVSSYLLMTFVRPTSRS
jgi:SAM-dependent methyltransferase